MTTRTQGKQAKKKDSKYRVKPNLTPRGKDIMMRLKNRSLNAIGGDNYTLDEEIVETRRLDKVELINRARLNHEKIKGLETKAENLSKEIDKQKSKPKEDDK